jgi:hypothetical protein
MSTVTEVLTAATDSVTLINEINAGTYDVEGMTQTEINEMVQRNIDHLQIILAYAPADEDDDTPDVAGSSEDKTSYTDAIATGNTYITDNS